MTVSHRKEKAFRERKRNHERQALAKELNDTNSPLSEVFVFVFSLSFYVERKKRRRSKMLRNVLFLFFSFRGRINRRQWWCGMPISWFSLLYIRETIAVNPNNFLFAVLISIPFLWVLFALHIKRHHDRNRPGWWTIVAMASLGIAWVIFLAVVYLQPIITLLWIVFFGCLRGDAGENRYGPPPKPLFLRR